MKLKENLIEKMGMQFDEAIELFSEETLQSMSMANIVGGEDSNQYCAGAQCVSGCNNNCKCTTTSTSKNPTTGSSSTNPSSTNP